MNYYTVENAREFISKNKLGGEQGQLHHRIQYMIEHMLTNPKYMTEKLNGWMEIANCSLDGEDGEEIIRQLRAGGWHIKLSSSGRSVAISFPPQPRPVKEMTGEDLREMNERWNKLRNDCRGLDGNE